MAKTRRQEGMVRRVSRSAREGYESARDRVVDAKESSGGFIRERPFVSIAIAAAVGAIVALGINALVKREKPTWRDRLRDYF